MPVAVLQSKEDADIPDAAELQYLYQRQLNAMAQKREILIFLHGVKKNWKKWRFNAELLNCLSGRKKNSMNWPMNVGSPIDLPEWDPDPNLFTCSNCGYALQPDWDECPICNQPIVPSR